jgi:hypothetical protein
MYLPKPIKIDWHTMRLVDPHLDTNLTLHAAECSRWRAQQQLERERTRDKRQRKQDRLRLRWSAK